MGKTENSLSLVDSYIDNLSALGKSTNTTKSYKKDLYDFMHHLAKIGKPLSQIDTNTVQTYVIALSKSLEPRSVRRKYAAINALLKWRGISIYGVQLPKIPRRAPKSLSMIDVNRILSETSKDKSIVGIRDLAILEVLYCAPRNGEVINIPIEAINLEEGTLTTISKGNKEMVYALSAGAVRALEKYIKASGSKVLFKMTPQNLIRIVKNRAFSAIGRIDITPHTFRHSIAKHMLDATGDIRAVQDMLGHANISTTTIYTEYQSSEKVSRIKKYHPRCK